jgi:hypothetical protein
MLEYAASPHSISGAMIYRLLADFVVIIHVGFVLFVVLGGFLLRRWPKLVYAHVPAAVWGVLIEIAGWVCPLTPLENSLRARGGQARYEGDFIEHYILPVLYPHGIHRITQLLLGVIALAINAVAYALYVRERRTA